MNVTQITVGAFQENCYLVEDPKTNAIAIVDPGSEPERIVDAIEESGGRVEAIWVTHAHVDHIGAIAPLKRKYNVPVWLHPLDEPLYRVGGRQAQLYGIPYEEPPAPDRRFAEGEKITLGALELDVIHVPGHAPGHVVIYGHGNALVGDCLFAGSIGRTDLPFSNPSQLEASLKRIAALPPETVVHPGHGDSTTIGEERLSNPFLNGTARIVRA
ncbi:MAG TPA: MBL fold metallo-hydrolase [Gemmatimonadaceae bacterium]|jgi:glyoxylase-like metal-dependent hydrolase (beta-lactamase superfamily II)|nr:MBL fold metallo-hydrolase [Gemmatimonadaceae bacterium]